MQGALQMVLELRSESPDPLRGKASITVQWQMIVLIELPEAGEKGELAGAGGGEPSVDEATRCLLSEKETKMKEVLKVLVWRATTSTPTTSIVRTTCGADELDPDWAEICL